MKTGDKCVLVVGDKVHRGTVLSFTPPRPVSLQGTVVSVDPGEVTVKVEGVVIFTGSNGDKIFELNPAKTEHPIVISQSNTDLGSPPTSIVMAYLKANQSTAMLQCVCCTWTGSEAEATAGTPPDPETWNPGDPRWFDKTRLPDRVCPDCGHSVV